MKGPVKTIKASTPEWDATIRLTGYGLVVVDVQRKGEAPVTKTTAEPQSSGQAWANAAAKRKQQQQNMSFTCGSEEEARQALNKMTKFRINFTEETHPWSSGQGGITVEAARDAVLKAKEERGKSVQPTGVVLTDAEKAEIRKNRAMAFMGKHPEFISNGFVWEKMIRCAIEAGFIPNQLEPCTVEQWEFCYDYLLTHSMIPLIEGQTTPVNPYRFVREGPKPKARQVSVDQARREHRGLSTEALEAQEKARQDARKAERNGTPVPDAEPTEVSREDAEKMSTDQLTRIEQQRQGIVRRRGFGLT